MSILSDHERAFIFLQAHDLCTMIRLDEWQWYVFLRWTFMERSKIRATKGPWMGLAIDWHCSGVANFFVIDQIQSSDVYDNIPGLRCPVVHELLRLGWVPSRKCFQSHTPVLIIRIFLIIPLGRIFFPDQQRQSFRIYEIWSIYTELHWLHLLSRL